MGSYYHTAKQLRDLDARILAVLIATCGITDPADAVALSGPASFTVNTDAGELLVKFDPGYKADMPNRGKVGLPGSVFCRFTDPKLADSLVAGVNPFSGKWNFHFGSTFIPEAMATAIAALNPRDFMLRPRFWYPTVAKSDAV